MKKIAILTLFPEFFESLQKHSIMKRAIDQQLVNIEVINIRDFSELKNKQVDDYSYGGGSGMVMMCAPIVHALEKIDPEHQAKRILLSPQGLILNHLKAREYATNNQDIVFICGHYEGIDERIMDYVDEELSVGDFVLTGGETALVPIIDAIVRLIPGVIKEESTANDSFENDLLDHPHYTKPRNFRNQAVPKVLLSGDHQKIANWRKEQAIKKTKLRKPHLLKNKKGK